MDSKVKFAALGLAAVFLAGCQTVKPVTGSCGVFKVIPIHPSDSVRTKNRLVVHNETGAKVCGWKTPRRK